jgi:hypothetical protein
LNVLQSVQVRRAVQLAILLGGLCAFASRGQQQATSQRPPSFDLETKRFDVDVDGAPNAYGPPGKQTLDALRNAHYRGWKNAPIVGYLTDDDNPHVPVLQGPHDPYPGFYISQTAFTDPARTREADPLRYVDAAKINYMVRGSEAKRRGVQLGDFVAVHSWRTGRTVFGIVADDGNPSGDEGSLHLMQDLGYHYHWGRDEGIDEGGEITVRYFPGSNPAHRFFRAQPALDAAARGLRLDGTFTKPATPGKHPKKH